MALPEGDVPLLEADPLREESDAVEEAVGEAVAETEAELSPLLPDVAFDAVESDALDEGGVELDVATLDEEVPALTEV